MVYRKVSSESSIFKKNVNDTAARITVLMSFTKNQSLKKASKTAGNPTTPARKGRQLYLGPS
eukprot:912776-Amphidinium_carterae.1